MISQKDYSAEFSIIEILKGCKGLATSDAISSQLNKAKDLYDGLNYRTLTEKQRFQRYLQKICHLFRFEDCENFINNDDGD